MDATRIRELARHRQRRRIEMVDVERRVHRLDLPLGIHECKVTLFGLRITSAPLGDLGPEALQLVRVSLGTPLAVLVAHFK
jgi:hypothetical protein